MATGLRFTRRQLLGTMAATGLTAAFYPRIAVSQDGKILRVRSYSDIQNLDPAYRKAAPEDDIMRNIFVGLAGMKAGDEWKWELDGASKLEQVDDTHIAFTLMDGLVWTDGFGPVTADDVKYLLRAHGRPEDGIALCRRLGGARPCRGDGREIRRDRAEGAVPAAVERRPRFRLRQDSVAQGHGGRRAGKFDTKPPAQAGRYLLKEWLPKQRTVLAQKPRLAGRSGAMGRNPRHPDRGREDGGAGARGRRPRLYLGRRQLHPALPRRRRRRAARST